MNHSQYLCLFLFRITRMPDCIGFQGLSWLMTFTLAGKDQISSMQWVYAEGMRIRR